ncbi:hypothetical protein BDV24DRAFT_127127 [Aspergillus arachidicola]|uniref:Uncharacterized protein n=1 Tax=Aspergillus arachidicola TaxID=656916 RepID=A0A5N6YLH9_9EURO|nr:hypothetical protein BDV24DRAFT_127127 [Aspergillus arachidicola]
MSISTCPVARRSFTTSVEPLAAAPDKGVLQTESLVSIYTCPVSRRSFTTASWPFSAATYRGVWP